MTRVDWTGVFPAVTTPFRPDHSLDREALHHHVNWLADVGCQGIVALDAMGEGTSLTDHERVRVLNTCRYATRDRLPLVASIFGTSTAECVARAHTAYAAGCDGLMVAPPQGYRGDWREVDAHLSAVLAATPLSCILYNHPDDCGTDLAPIEIAALAHRHVNLHAVKESSGDVRRITAIRQHLGDRVALLAGVDDLIVESVAMGATGWVASLANALPDEVLKLFDISMEGRPEEGRVIYDALLPLLRLDSAPKYVQLVKLVQAEVGRGSARVRPPRLELDGAELDLATLLIRASLGQHVA